MTFKGMNPEEGREVASSISEAGQQILEAIDASTSLVNAVEWIGPDYDAYQEGWNAFVSGPVANLVEGFQRRSDELGTHAEQQDAASNQQ